MNVLRTPSAWIPIGLSLAGLGLVVGHALVYGIVHEPDEGTAAHVFQLLMVAQVPIVAFFAFRWLPQQPKQAAIVLLLQAVAFLAAWASVYFLT